MMRRDYYLDTFDNYRSFVEGRWTLVGGAGLSLGIAEGSSEGPGSSLTAAGLSSRGAEGDSSKGSREESSNGPGGGSGTWIGYSFNALRLFLFSFFVDAGSVMKI